MEKRERPNTPPKRDYCNFLASYLDAVYELDTIEEQAAALFAILEFMVYDIEPHDLRGGAAILFRMAKPVIVKTIRKQTASRDNGKQGGRKPKPNPTQTQTEPNTNPTQSKSNREKDIGIRSEEKDKGIRGEDKGVTRASAQELTHTPIAEQWFSYMAECGKPLTERQKQVIEGQLASNMQQYGEQPVKVLVQTMIGEGRTAIYFDRLTKQEQKQELRGFDALIAMEEAAAGSV